MRSGFFTSPPPGGVSQEPTRVAGQPTASSSSQQSTGPPAKAPASCTPEQYGASLQQCLALLKGPTDEKRFVGLLLVTRLLPAGDDNAIKAVAQAVGSRFLQRLLLPLHSWQRPDVVALDAEGRQKQRASCELALAVLSSFCRVPELAQSDDVVDKVPLLVRVVKAGGLTKLLPGADLDVPAGDHAASDASAVQDALECLTAIANGSAEGQTVCLESQGVNAGCCALQASTQQGADWRGLPMQLLGTLAAAAASTPGALEGSNKALALQAVPGLAHLLAAPAATIPVRQGQAGTEPPSPGRSAPARVADPLALQLEALHVLLLVLSLPEQEVPELHELLAESAHDHPDGWAADVRQGLALLLGSRIGVVQRQAALQLAAAVAQILPPQWVLGSVGTQAPADEFFRLLVEVLKIEVNISLQDALSPAAPVPSASQPGVAAPDYRPPLSSFMGTGKEDDDDDEEDFGESDRMQAGFGSTGTAGAGPALFAGAAARTRSMQSASAPGAEPNLAASSQAACVVEEEDFEPSAQQATAHEGLEAVSGTMSGPEAASAPGAAADAGQRSRAQRASTAGERAARVLPVCFVLLEAVIEVLASDQDNAEMQDQASGGMPSQQPRITDAVAARAMTSLTQTFDAVLQYLEAVQADPAARDDPCDLAAIRALGRYLAEVPDAFAERVGKLLPCMLNVGGGEARQFLLPALMQSDHADAVAAGPHTMEYDNWLSALMAAHDIAA